MRPLTLHASALSDAEYDFYTASFQDLVDDGSASAQSDAYYEDTTIGVREARAWLRGRYPELNMGDLDLVCETRGRRVGADSTRLTRMDVDLEAILSGIGQG
jgi:hypothetical protein